MNETAAIEPRVWIGPDRLLFRGVLPTLDWHRHPFHCVLFAVDRPFEIEDRAGRHRCRLVLVPGGREHRLRFDGQRMMTVYIPPHDAHFPGLVRPAGVSPAEAGAGWADALAAWDAAEDPGPLRGLIHSTWGRGKRTPRPMDHRVRRLARRFAEGQALRDDPAALAAWLGLSPSRLRHVVKDHTGASLGEMQRGYMFVAAARSMLAQASFTRAAHAAGFADGAHFSRAFRAAYGIAPSRILFAATRWALHGGL